YWNNPSVIVWWMLAKGVNWLVEISQKPIENQIERLSGQAPYLLNTSWEKPVSEGVLKIEIAVMVSVQRPIWQLTTMKPIHQLTGPVVEENAEESGQVAGGCVLGASVSMTADTVGLTQAYGHFKYEALNLDPAYAPKTVNEDGWSATHNSLRSLFEGITPIRTLPGQLPAKIRAYGLVNDSERMVIVLIDLDDKDRVAGKA
ncbi:MAG: hypothetical protein AAF639_45720, partial [Chloroflexota bacterium]